jgi:sulfane dehydrogenase subunit SoxC
MKPAQLDEGPIEAAGRGLLQRRVFLQHSGFLAALAGGSKFSMAAAASAEPSALSVPDWSKLRGSPFVGYGQLSKFESGVVRIAGSAPNPHNAPGTGAVWAPLHRLHGTITPNGLHFERSHSGIPDIDPDVHRLLIHGLVKRPLIFTLEALARYPMESRITFVECSGNSLALYAKQVVEGTAQTLHGLASCAEWTGVKLSILLDEAGVDPAGEWLLAEGADAAGMDRSIPMKKAIDDAMIALYQNGERLRPSNGYPMRLLLPGYEGNMNVKWLRRLKVTAGPAMTREETSKYTMLLPNGTAWQFFYPMGAKSVITHPSPGLTMQGAGLYEVSGLAWSGKGRISKVEVAADGGRSWAPAVLQEPILPIAFTRFRIPWKWDGGSATLQSRATDEAGNVQPTRSQLIAERGNKPFYHFNAISGWAVSEQGTLKHVYF